jgi:YfiH family protein
MPSCHAAPHFARRGDFYRCVPFEAFGWLTHGFSTRDARLPDGITTLRQVHSTSVRNAVGLADRAAEGDALISNGVGTFVGVRTADCVPILLADPETRAVAAIHAGWRGSSAEIARHTVECLYKEFGTEPAHVHAAFGPSIRVCCYEVGREVAEQFRGIFPQFAFNDGSVPEPGRHREKAVFQRSSIMLDLVEANRRILIATGVPENQIYDSGLCTACCPALFHSYRRDPRDPGRMVAFIGRTH